MGLKIINSDNFKNFLNMPIFSQSVFYHISVHFFPHVIYLAANVHYICNITILILFWVPGVI